jgi:hypothetical protein
MSRSFLRKFEIIFGGECAAADFGWGKGGGSGRGDIEILNCNFW